MSGRPFDFPATTTTSVARTDTGAAAPDVETASEKYAARFAGAAGRYLLDVQAQAIRAAMPRLAHPNVLEVGGGHGQLIPVLDDLGCELTVLGSDEACWQRVRRLGAARSARLVTGDLLELPFPDDEFDAVVAVRLIAHIDSWPRLLREFCRVARHSVVFDYPSKRSLNSLSPLLFSVKRSLEPSARTYATYAREELQGVLEEAGFSVALEYKQFVLPMALHRVTGGHLRSLEWLARECALTSRFGSPVVLRADRAAGLH